MAIKLVKIDATECTCERCGYVWIPRAVKEGDRWVTPTPIGCGSCKSAYWKTAAIYTRDSARTKARRKAAKR